MAVARLSFISVEILSRILSYISPESLKATIMDSAHVKKSAMALAVAVTGGDDSEAEYCAEKVNVDCLDADLFNTQFAAILYESWYMGAGN